MAWTQSGNIKGASGSPGASGAQGASGVPGASGASGAVGASGGTGGTGGPGTTSWAGITDKPGSILIYQGLWNASTNSPTLADNTGTAGYVYRVSTGGTRNLGSGNITFDVGDYVIYSSVNSAWEKADTTDAVSSVAGRTGDVTLTVADVTGNTTTALGVGSIELGHASDTTVSRSSAGVLAVEGVVIPSISSTNALTNKDLSSATNTFPAFIRQRSISTVTSNATVGSTANTDYVVFTNVASDPFISSVTALLHLDGSNNSTTITDSSPVASNWTATGNAKITTAQQKFGTGSLVVDNTTNTFIKAASTSANYGFGTGDFSIEMFIRFNGIAQDDYVFDFRTGGTAFVTISSSPFKLQYYSSDTLRITGSTTVTTGTWYHLAVCRSGTTTRMFLNGTQEGSSYTGDTTNHGNSQPVIGNRYADAYYMDGWVDEVRITKGVARYTANFTAPTAAFAESAATVTVPTAVSSTNEIRIKNIHPTDGIIVNTTSSQTIDGASTLTLNSGSSAVRLISDNANWRTT